MAMKRRLPDGNTAFQEGLERFRTEVKELKTKSQSRIMKLTTLADNLYEVSQEVTELLTEEIALADLSRVQALISVVDSILKKVGRDYKAHLSARIPDVLHGVVSKSDQKMRAWLQKMVSESWRKHELFPLNVLDILDRIFSEPPQVLSPPAPAAAPAAPAVAPKKGQETPTAPPTPVAPATAPRPTAPVARETPAPSPVVPQGPSAVPSLAATTAPAPTKAPVSGPSSPPSPTTLPGALAAVLTSATGPGSGLAQLLESDAAPAKPETSGSTGRRSSAAESQAQIERRLSILAKIKKKSPGQEELQEIMKVPEIRKAIQMHQKGDRHEAMTLLSQFKQELERKHSEYSEQQDSSTVPEAKAPERKPTDPRAAARSQELKKQLDPRQLDSAQPHPKPVDPRQVDQSQPDGKATSRQVDPRVTRPVDPRQLERRSSEPVIQEQGATQKLQAEDGSRTGKRVSQEQLSSLRQKHQKTGSQQADYDESIPLEAVSDDETHQDGSSKGQGAAMRQALQGLPSIGFSEAWLRQFIEQMPARVPAQGSRASTPAVGRKVLGASGEQMVYVDELCPGEVLLLMQLIFLLEEHLRRSGAGIDLAQRIPHTFSYLQVEPAMDVMRKRFFDELPFQCTTTGLRFPSREKLRKHHDALYRRRTLLQQRQRGAEARGWMESIPEWVGNRDLVVGPALFRLGTVSEELNRSSDGLRGLPESTVEAQEKLSEGRWICPMDERRSVCPVSGEAFDVIWSPVLNDWAYDDVVAVELGSEKPLKFAAGDSHGFSETAVLFRRSCFFNTPSSKRLQSLEECRSMNSRSTTASAVEVGRPGVAEDPELTALSAARPASGKFF